MIILNKNNSGDRDAAFDMASLLSGNRTEEYALEVAEHCAEDQCYRNDMNASAEVLADMSGLEGSDFIEQIAAKPVRSKRRPVFAIAASLLLVAGLLAIQLPVSDAPSVKVSRYLTTVGEQKDVALADGSTLSLNTNTEILVALGGGNRQVTLKRGEAFFDVASQPDNPFTIDVGPHRVTVLGTAFNIRKEPGSVAVAVAEGVVAVHRPEDPVNTAISNIHAESAGVAELSGAQQHKLTAGQAITLDQKGYSLAELPANKIAGWRGGMLGFAETPLVEVVRELNRYSAKKILIEDASIMGLSISATMNIDRIGTSIRGLEMTHDIIAKHYVDRIVLVGK